PCVAIEPSPQCAVYIVRSLADVEGCLRGPTDLSQDCAGRHQGLRIPGWTLARKLCERITQTLGFLQIHRCDPVNSRATRQARQRLERPHVCVDVLEAGLVDELDDEHGREPRSRTPRGSSAFLTHGATFLEPVRE